MRMMDWDVFIVVGGMFVYFNLKILIYICLNVFGPFLMTQMNDETQNNSPLGRDVSEYD